MNSSNTYSQYADISGVVPTEAQKSPSFDTKYTVSIPSIGMNNGSDTPASDYNTVMRPTVADSPNKNSTQKHVFKTPFIMSTVNKVSSHNSPQKISTPLPAPTVHDITIGTPFRHTKTPIKAPTPKPLIVQESSFSQERQLTPKTYEAPFVRQTTPKTYESNAKPQSASLANTPKTYENHIRLQSTPLANTPKTYENHIRLQSTPAGSTPIRQVASRVSNYIKPPSPNNSLVYDPASAPRGFTPTTISRSTVQNNSYIDNERKPLKASIVTMGNNDPLISNRRNRKFNCDDGVKIQTTQGLLLGKLTSKTNEDIMGNKYDYDTMDESEKIFFINDYKTKFKNLRNVNKDIVIPDDWNNLNMVEKLYERELKKYQIENKINNWDNYLYMFYLMIELGAKKIAKTDIMDGFANFQKQKISSYRDTMFELGELMILEKENNMHPALSLTLSVLSQTGIFFAFVFVSKCGIPKDKMLEVVGNGFNFMDCIGLVNSFFGNNSDDPLDSKAKTEKSDPETNAPKQTKKNKSKENAGNKVLGAKKDKNNEFSDFFN